MGHPGAQRIYRLTQVMTRSYFPLQKSSHLIICTRNGLSLAGNPWSTQPSTCLSSTPPLSQQSSASQPAGLKTFQLNKMLTNQCSQYLSVQRNRSSGHGKSLLVGAEQRATSQNKSTRISICLSKGLQLEFFPPPSDWSNLLPERESRNLMLPK